MPTGSILVADDDAAIRTVLNQALSRAGYEVRSTGNAATLWRWVTQGDGDLVITDVVMPDENAFDLIPRIRKARPDLPIVVMSAQNEECPESLPDFTFSNVVDRTEYVPFGVELLGLVLGEIRERHIMPDDPLAAVE